MNSSENIAKNALEIGIQDLSKDFEKVIIPTLEEVKQAAIKFCMEYEKSQKLYQQWLKAKNKKSNRRQLDVI